MGLPLLQGPTAFLATTSIATVGLALCYGLPIGLHIFASNRFEAGPVTLGRYVMNQFTYLLTVQQASGVLQLLERLVAHPFVILFGIVSHA